MINSTKLLLFYKIGECSKTLNYLYDIKITGKVIKMKQVDSMDLSLGQTIEKEEKKLISYLNQIELLGIVQMKVCRWCKEVVPDDTPNPKRF